MVHRPQTMAEALSGRDRLAFEELLFVHLLHQRMKTLARETRRGIRFVNKRNADHRGCASRCPTRSPAPRCGRCARSWTTCAATARMHRLLQGDVGSGKTIVALFAALLALENGYQAAIMAPTELLAEQHQRTMTGLLSPLGIVPLLLTGSVPARERKAIARRLARLEPPLGEEWPELVVGTHALVQEATEFARLGFVAIDEQHRFGVEQRKALTAKGEIAGRTADERDADSAVAGAHRVRRSRSQLPRRAARRAGVRSRRSSGPARRATG